MCPFHEMTVSSVQFLFQVVNDFIITQHSSCRLGGSLALFSKFLCYFLPGKTCLPPLVFRDEQQRFLLFLFFFLWKKLCDRLGVLARNIFQSEVMS